MVRQQIERSVVQLYARVAFDVNKGRVAVSGDPRYD